MRKHDIKGGRTDYFCIKTPQKASVIDFLAGSPKKPGFLAIFGIFWTATRRPKIAQKSGFSAILALIRDSRVHLDRP